LRYGQVGTGAALDTYQPQAVAPGFGAVDFTLGGRFACGIGTDDRVRCAGRNGDHQLGDGLTTDSTIPVMPVSTTAAVRVVAGARHACALTPAGDVECWGCVLHPGTQAPCPMTSDGFAITLPAPAVSITGSNRHTCALLADRTLWCWGDNSTGQLGDGTTTSSATVAVKAQIDEVVAVSGGREHVCALRTDRSVWCWGTGFGSAPAAINLTDIDEIAAGGFHTCARRGTTLWCWGSNGFGQLGDGTRTDRMAPGLVSLPPILGMSAGATHTCAIGANGEVYCFGQNVDGQVGIEDPMDVLSPATLRVACP
jgi:alpha-tubulin suppressor-like RCC1 family protein